VPDHRRRHVAVPRRHVERRGRRTSLRARARRPYRPAGRYPATLRTVPPVRNPPPSPPPGEKIAEDVARSPGAAVSARADDAEPVRSPPSPSAKPPATSSPSATRQRVNVTPIPLEPGSAPELDERRESRPSGRADCGPPVQRSRRATSSSKLAVTRVARRASPRPPGDRGRGSPGMRFFEESHRAAPGVRHFVRAVLTARC